LLWAGAGGLSIVAARAAHPVSAEQGPPSTFTLVTNRAPSDLDPHSAYDAGSGTLLQGPFEGLIRLRSGTLDEFVPLLAESWQSNPDKSVWTFRLREGVTFHDGTRLDAEAARASFERQLSLGFAPATVLGRFIDDPAMISALDDRTLVFDLGRPRPLFEAAIASAFGTAIVNVAALRMYEVDGNWGHAWAQTNSAGIGTGPYQVVDFDIARGASLQRFDSYWRGWQGQHFDRIEIRVVPEAETRRALIERADADLAANLPLSAVHELAQDPHLIVDLRYNLTVRYLAMTVAGSLRSREARQALCWAFPYDDVVEGVYGGFAKRARGPVAELCRGFDPSTFLYQTDLERARSLLRSAGVAEGAVLSLMLPPGNPENSEIVELFQANLAAIGIVLDIQPVDFATYVGIVLGDEPAEARPNLLPAFWQPDYNDGWNHLWPQVSCAAWQAGNGGHYCNPRVETLLDQARDAYDDITYQAALSEIQQLVTRDVPAAIYEVQPHWPTVLRRDVAGFTPDLINGDIIDFYALHRG
jgi:peptide/nickel transport system substrate-binding protein